MNSDTAMNSLNLPLLREALQTALPYVESEGTETEAALVRQALTTVDPHQGIVSVTVDFMVMTRDRHDEHAYQVGGIWPDEEKALRFARQCLRGNRRKYARIVGIETTRFVAKEQP